jgi:hypothetical protein
LVNVAIKDVEKFCPEVDRGLLAEDPGFLAEREVFVPASERPGSGKGPGFVAEGQGTCG